MQSGTKRRIAIWTRFLSVMVVALVACHLVLTTGCAEPDGPKRYKVSGSVTFEGEPVATGEVQFWPQEEGGAPDAGPIENGSYTLMATEGAKKVVIQSVRPHPTETETDIEGNQVPVMEKYLPDSCGKDGTLTATVETKSQTIDFAITAE